MHLRHEEIPASADEAEEQQPREEMDVGHFPQVPLPQKEEQAGEARQEQADGAFGQYRQPGRRPAQEIIPPVLCIAQIEERHRGGHEEEQRRICDDRLRQQPEFQRQRQNDRRGPRRALIVDPPGEPEKEQHIHTAQHRRGEAGRPVVEAEDREGERQLPVEEDRLVIPVPAVDLRRQPVPGEHHFPRGERVIRLRRIRHGDQRIADEVQIGGQKKQKKIRMTADTLQHTKPPE